MWKNTNLHIYTPPTYINRITSPSIYKAVNSNTVENVTELPFVTKKLLKVKFTAIQPTLYNNLRVNTFITDIHTNTTHYSPITFTEFTPANSYTTEDDLYQSTDISSLYINTFPLDIYIQIAYEVTNISTLKEIAIFTADTNLKEIWLQNNTYSTKQLITTDFLTNLAITSETVLTFVYDYKIFDNTTNTSFNILNNSVVIKDLPLLLFNHTYENYADLDLIIYKDRTYKRLYDLDSIDKLFHTKTYPGFIVNDEYISILLT